MERRQLGEGHRALLGSERLRRTLSLLVALGLVAPASAAGVERISSPFLLEYSSESYSIDQGELVTFANYDPFLRHGLASDLAPGGQPLFEAPVIAREQVRLVRGTPFLTRAGSPYTFHDPDHPQMTATLVVGPGGAPLPPDATRPGASVKILSGNVGKVAGARKLRLAVGLSEPVDAVIKARLGGRLVGRAERTYLSPGRRGVTLELAKHLPRAGSPLVRVVVRMSDVAGNLGKAKASRRLAGGGSRKKD